MKATDYRLRPQDIDDMTLAQLRLYFEPIKPREVWSADRLKDHVRNQRLKYAETLPPKERAEYLEQMKRAEQG